MLTVLSLICVLTFRVLAESMGLTVPQDNVASNDWHSQSCHSLAVTDESPAAALPDEDDEQLKMALQLSESEQREIERQRRQEEEELEMILKLSLTDK
jgi:uncharacterized membrane protein